MANLSFKIRSKQIDWSGMAGSFSSKTIEMGVVLPKSGRGI
jgi:hypothetical protein